MKTTLRRKAVSRKVAARIGLSAAVSAGLALAGHASLQEAAPAVAAAPPSVSAGGKIDEALGGFRDEGPAPARPSQPVHLARIFSLPVNLTADEAVWTSDRGVSAMPAVAQPVRHRSAVASASGPAQAVPRQLREARHMSKAVMPPSRPILAEAPSPEPRPQTAGSFLGVRLSKLPFGDRVGRAVDGLSASLSQMIGRS